MARRLVKLLIQARLISPSLHAILTISLFTAVLGPPVRVTAQQASLEQLEAQFQKQHRAILEVFTNGPARRAFHSVQSMAGTNPAERTRGIELYRQGKFAEASKLLQKAVKVNKADDEAWYYLGLAFFHQPKKIKDAGKAFETAVKLRPAFAAAHVGLAYTHLRRNKSSEAVQVSRTALNLDPSLAEPHHIIGVVHLNAGDPDEALTEAKEAIRLNSELPAGYRLKSQALVSVYAKRTLASSLAAKTSSSPQTPKHRAERHKRRLESTAVFKEAAESLDIYLRLDPSSSSADYLREQLVSLTFYGRYTGDKTNVDDAPYSADEVTTKARVLAKPEPAYTESAREALVSGTVVLQAVFSADGKVRHILVLAGLPNGLTETAVRAARQIKFTPATIDLRPVSTFVRMEYNFNLY